MCRAVTTEGRYDASASPEGQCEPGSGNRVLRNRLGITTPEEMDLVKTRALGEAMATLPARYDEKHRFTAVDIREFHRAWLGEIYEWAGAYRHVNLSKDGFPFAAADQVPSLMEKYERGVLAVRTPCRSANAVDTALAIAETHVELVLIHPFRDGNGRVARVLSSLMALQAGFPLLNFDLIAEENRDGYFAAVRAGMDRDYKPMARIFADIIDRSLSPL